MHPWGVAEKIPSSNHKEDALKNPTWCGQLTATYLPSTVFTFCLLPCQAVHAMSETLP
ncbi:hypothetical protein M378DRAFT_165653 [Amanita muscaria Koide BX008]|uniref:Uncharacterized protein n=1 Tax=Amanita muscaria (strain Koide BX008) TaxID=946122 RepID=A0A0C2X179_AMAMK|nr:hypothetical protein M378DRAFT_165653 [Amanita muscaria Koide BX008]